MITYLHSCPFLKITLLLVAAVFERYTPFSELTCFVFFIYYRHVCIDPGIIFCLEQAEYKYNKVEVIVNHK